MLIDRLLAGLRAALTALRGRPGIIASLAIHLALIALLIGVHPARNPEHKRGDALIVELPSPQEPANVGTPGPVPGASPEPAAPSVRAAPPAPKPSPTPRPQIAARPAPKASESREAPRTAAPPPQPAPPAPSPRAPSPPPPAPAAEQGDVPAAKSEPAEPAPEVAKAPEQPAPPAAAAPPAVASAPPSPPGPVAMVPPAPPDIRSALRRGGGGGGSGPGGAGGLGVGRGGIVGDPVPLDSKDGDVRDYLDRIKRLIQKHWVFPCVKDRQTGVCEYKSTELLVEFGILKHGPLQYIEVRRASPYEIYDDYAVTAVKLASPFPPVPAAMMARMRPGSTGTAISARFVYHFETGITNLLR